MVGDLSAMTPEERDRMAWLCTRIQEEKDPKVFGELVVELDELLTIKEQRLDEKRRLHPN